MCSVEPFLRSILRALYRRRLDDLLRRAGIEIPDDQGRLMMGTVDETSTLEYGEVFVRYSTHISKPQRAMKIVTGPVLVAKNPCLHPGDMRKFKAVDRPELYHMVDCIVFPAKGKRPHPNEMSGSDLDGDKYFVCWMEDLLPARDNEEAMDYSPQPKSDLGHEIAAPDMMEFISEYLQCDRLGPIATAHLVHADADAYGIFSYKCLELAKLHSDAVDSSKTGYLPKLSNKLRPTAYPHYMEKSSQPMYTSKHVIGELFDQCQMIEQPNFSEHAISEEVQPVVVTSPFQRGCKQGWQLCYLRDKAVHQSPSSDGVQLDADLFMPGYEQYIQSDNIRELREFYSTSIFDLMRTFGIGSEAEMLSGHILKIRTKLGYLKNCREEIRKLVKEQLKCVFKQIRTMFFQEFEQEKATDSNVLRKASALYVVTYTDWAKDRLLGLPWIFSDLLVEIKKGATTSIRNRTMNSFFQDFRKRCPRSSISTFGRRDEETVDQLSTVFTECCARN